MSSDKKPVSAQIFKLKVSKVNTNSLAAYYGQLEIIEDVCIKGRNMRALLTLNNYLIAFSQKDYFVFDSKMRCVRGSDNAYSNNSGVIANASLTMNRSEIILMGAGGCLFFVALDYANEDAQ